MKWWNRMLRHAHMIEGFDYSTVGVAYGSWFLGPTYVAERVRMPGDPPPVTFTVTSITYPKSKRPPKGPRS